MLRPAPVSRRLRSIITTFLAVCVRALWGSGLVCPICPSSSRGSAVVMAPPGRNAFLRRRSTPGNPPSRASSPSVRPAVGTTGCGEKDDLVVRVLLHVISPASHQTVAGAGSSRSLGNNKNEAIFSMSPAGSRSTWRGLPVQGLVWGSTATGIVRASMIGRSPAGGPPPDRSSAYRRDGRSAPIPESPCRRRPPGSGSPSPVSHCFRSGLLRSITGDDPITFSPVASCWPWRGSGLSGSC